MLALAGAIALGPNCVPVKRPARTSGSGEFAYSRAQDRSYDCDGAEVDRQTHDQFGGELGLRSQTASSRYGEARVTLLEGRYDEGNNIDPNPTRSPYVVFGLGGNVGWDFEYFGHEFGAIASASPSVRIGHEVPFVLPYYRLRIGDYYSLAVELQIGSQRAFLFDRRGAALGLRWHSAPFELHAGAAIGGSSLLDQRSDRERRLLIGSSAEDADWIGYADAAFVLSPWWSVSVGLQLGSQPPLARVGLIYDIDVQPRRQP